jgi:hypothetical protein
LRLLPRASPPFSEAGTAKGRVWSEEEVLG